MPRHLTWLLFLVVACGYPGATATSSATAGGAREQVTAGGYDHNAPTAATTTASASRTAAPIARPSSRATSRSPTALKSRRRAAKGADEAVGGVYSLRNEAGDVVRTGRSKDLARREAEHARDPELGQYRFQPEYRTDDYATQRGLEQLLHNDWLPLLNKIRPISPRNPRLDEYLRSGREFRARR